MKQKYVAYLSLLTGSAGYYGYYMKNKEHLFVWAIVFLIGLVLLISKDINIYKKNKTKIVYCDILFVLGICAIPALKLPNGLAILFMVVGGALYAYKMIHYQFKQNI